MILQLKEGSSEVDVMHDALDAMMQELQLARAEVVSVISVMGAYRTGKSFLLGFLLRFLRKKLALQEEMRRAAKKDVDEEELVDVLDDISKEDQEESNEPLPIMDNYLDLKGKLYAEREESWKFGEDDSDKNKLPPWVHEVNKSHLPQNDGKGFAWKPGQKRCTQGIWLWSKPFVFPDKNGRRIAVLLMDTQGAWDDTMTRAQSATIFGMTALLSSKLVYNIQNRIGEADFDNLDYITTFTQTVCNDLPGRECPFGHLQVMVRDWVSYEEGWTMDECKQQMKDHLEDHLNIENVPQDQKDKVKRLREVFKSVSCFGLCNPGKKVTGTKYDGSLDVVDNDFFQLLDEFTCTFFAEDFPQPSAPLGCEITAEGFKRIVLNFAKTFQDQSEELAIGLREAFVNVNLMSARDNILKKFKDRLNKLIPKNSVIDPDTLKTKSATMVQECRDEFAVTLRPWRLPPEEEEKHVRELLETMWNDVTVRAAFNDKELEGAKLNMLATPAVGLAGLWLLSVHHWLLCLVGAFGVYLQLKKRSTEQDANMCSPGVLNQCSRDIQATCIMFPITYRRWKKKSE